MLTYKARRLMVTIVVALLTAAAAFFAVQVMYGSSYDPYENRADGAAGICPVENWESNGEGSSSKVYNCENEEQRVAAANVAATNHARGTNALSVIVTISVSVSVVVIAKTINDRVSRTRRKLDR